MNIEIIKVNDLEKSMWSGGTTTQIFIRPENMTVKDDFNYRISQASIEGGESTFTFFNEYSRYLVILEGDVFISHNDEEYQKLEPFQKHSFDGNIKTKSKCEGRVIDFNIIYKSQLGKINFDIINTKENKKIEIASNTFIYNHENTSKISIKNKEYKLDSREIMLIKNDENIEIEVSGLLIYGDILL